MTAPGTGAVSTVALSSTITPTTGVLRSVLPDHGLLLFDPATARAHALNESAGAVWTELERAAPASAAPGATASGATASAIVDAVSAGFTATVRDDIVAVLGEFAREGLVLVDGHPMVPDDPARARPHQQFANVPHTGEPAPDALASVAFSHRTRPFSAFGQSVSFQTTDPDLGRYLDSILEPLAGELPSIDVVTTRHEYSVVGPHPDPELDHLLALDGFRVGRLGDDSGVAAFLLWHANQLVCTGSTDRLLIHASAVAYGDAIVAFPASMNAGKSTLALGLVRAGFGYITDEAVGIPIGTHRVTPYPKPIALDPGSWELFTDLAPPPDPTFDRFSHRKWYIDPSRVRPDAIRREPGVLTAVVFAGYDPSTPTAMHPLDDATAAAASLAHHSFNLADAGQGGLDTIAEVVGACRCSTLSVHDLDSAVDAVRELIDT